MLIEIFNGPPGQEAYVLNPGDPGLLGQLDTIDAAVASKRPSPGQTTIAARTSWNDKNAAAALSTAAHTSYHIGAIRQMLAALQPRR